jgi:hypothetical protein
MEHALVMIAAPHPVPAVAERSATSPSRYGFAGGELGMAFAAWRASSPAAAAAACTVQGARQSCALSPIPLGGGFKARNLTFTFQQGRLVAIAFDTSMDGFDYATAALKRRFGDPETILRNTVRTGDGGSLPHVEMIWRNGRSTIRLSDPLPSNLSLSVRFSVNGARGGA